MRSLVRHSIVLVPWRLRSKIKQIPFVAWFQRRLLAAVLHGQEFTHRIDAGPARGLLFPVVLPDDKGVWTGTYELDFVGRLAAAVRPGDVCFDVGGWRGYCAGVMACAKAAKTYVFEPLPANCERIRRLIELNPNLPISLESSAVSDKNGTMTFCLMSETSMGKLETSPFQKSAVADRQVTVNVVTLDSFCEQNHIDTVNVIKFDVEGAELMAVHGAEQLLRRCRPHLFIEAHSRDLTRDVTAFLQGVGYQVITLETGVAPDGKTEPEVCHLQATAKP